MDTTDDTTEPPLAEDDSGVKGAFTARELAFEAWLDDEWPLWRDSEGTVFYHQRRAAFRAGFDAGVGFAA